MLLLYKTYQCCWRRVTYLIWWEKHKIKMSSKTSTREKKETRSVSVLSNRTYFQTCITRTKSCQNLNILHVRSVFLIGRNKITHNLSSFETCRFVTWGQQFPHCCVNIRIHISYLLCSSRDFGTLPIIWRTHIVSTLKIKSDISDSEWVSNTSDMKT